MVGLVLFTGRDGMGRCLATKLEVVARLCHALVVAIPLARWLIVGRYQTGLSAAVDAALSASSATPPTSQFREF